MKIALVLRLASGVEKKIKKFKKLFKTKHLKCLYIDDFPHLTLFTMDTYLKKNFLKKIELNKCFKKIPIKIGKPDIFAKDILTGGKTFFYRINKNKKLFDLQHCVINIFKKYKIKEKTSNKFHKNTLEYKSFKKYGFPYVGKHWIPHISICSILDKNINNELAKKFFKSKINLDFYVYELSLCVVTKKSLKEVKKINFLNK